MNFKYYFFDLDNCILHFIEKDKYFDRIFALILKKFLGFIPKSEERYKVWQSSNLNQYLHDIWGIEKFDEFWKYYRTFDVQNRKKLIEIGKIFLDPVGIDVIKKLRKQGKKIALITNSPRYITDLLCEHFNLSQIFDEILSVDYEKHPSLAKPSPKGISYVLKDLCSSKQIQICKFESIMIGDSKEDIIAAKKAGIYSCIIINKRRKDIEFQEWKYKPNFIIHNFYELFDL